MGEDDTEQDAADEETHRAAVLSKATDMLDRLRAVDSAITATLKIIQRLDLEDPNLTATLRRHNLIQEMSGVASTIAELEIATGTFFKSLDL